MRFGSRAPSTPLFLHCAGFPAGSAAALGAWTVLREVAAQDPSAPSWQFLQDRWTAVKQRAAGHAPGAGADEAGVTDEAASLLLVISHTTAGFPKEQAEELATELLQVGLCQRGWRLCETMWWSLL